MIYLLRLLIVFATVLGTQALAIDMAEVEKKISTQGVQGWIHGSNRNLGLVVFTLRDSKNFFDYELFPIRGLDLAVHEELFNFKRHDKVKIVGEFIKNQAPIHHIRVARIQMVKEYKGNLDHKYEVQLPENFPQEGEAIAKVHAIHKQGVVLVLEIGEVIFPVLAINNPVSPNLYRNDKVFVKYKTAHHPGSPQHLRLDVDKLEPLKVLNRIVDKHGEKITLSGSLVMYPQSPQILFNVFALQNLDDDSIERDYTLVNFTEMQVFTDFRARLQIAWDQQKATAQARRNKWLNPKIKITATGTKNVISPNQANPQILIEKNSDIKIEFLP